MLALEHDGPAIYNIVDDEPAPLREWLPVLATALGAKPPRRFPRWLARLVAVEAAVVTQPNPAVLPTRRQDASAPGRPGIRAGGRGSSPPTNQLPSQTVRKLARRPARGTRRASGSPSSQRVSQRREWAPGAGDADIT